MGANSHFFALAATPAAWPRDAATLRPELGTRQPARFQTLTSTDVFVINKYKKKQAMIETSRRSQFHDVTTVKMSFYLDMT